VGHEQITPTKEYSPESLKSYTEKQAPALRSSGHLGLWYQPKQGVYHDVSDVHPPTYAGGVKAIVQAQPIMAKTGKIRRGEQSIYNIGESQTLTMKPKIRSEKRETRSSMRKLRGQAPQGKIRDMPTSQLAAGFRNRRTVP
jgi:hypothetical protein